MNRLRILLPLLILLGLLAACGGQTGTSTVATSPTASLEDLPQEVDVQTVHDLQGRDDVVVLDVREQYEYDEKHIPNVTLIPMSEIQNRIDEVPKDKEVFVTCRSGNRSEQVTQFLSQNGYDNVHNMQGGIIAWEEAGFPVEQ